MPCTTVTCCSWSATRPLKSCAPSLLCQQFDHERARDSLDAALADVRRQLDAAQDRIAQSEAARVTQAAAAPNVEDDGRSLHHLAQAMLALKEHTRTANASATSWRARLPRSASTLRSCRPSGRPSSSKRSTGSRRRRARWLRSRRGPSSIRRGTPRKPRSALRSCSRSAT
ncbi:hypothetical protein AMAG_19043 [Allomyces macrogynus ATCC 38327]|uniref:Uncharacterized protein n=1 Tax=Allomyces macrogynus (strain ATCC 38327) TaxID=578462 RepID=A0A0L0SMB9_ALLM3|nr:hypothetical protein AMAG_19043 [Allomyces macrogynus ATCC 38327]|eukprot:KNE63716.1 hypothetical protein AMAG_19043 [Allomyces macrogynus ATCC 38327]